MQNKTLVNILVAVAVVAVGAFILIRTNATPAPVTVDTPSQLSSLKDLLARKGTQTCSFTASTKNTQSSGTVYINNGTMRGDFVSVTAGQTTQSHIIAVGGSVYVWSDGISQGYKMPVTNITNNATGTTPGGIQAAAPAGYTCGAWTPDVSVFALPTGISFQDVGAAVQ